MLGTQQKAEQGVIQSSIALLQERFKQLQRVKEMREQRQLLQIFSSDISNTNTNTNNNNNKNPSSCITLSTNNNTSPTISTNNNNNNNSNNSFYYNNDSLSNANDNDNDNNNNNKLQVFLPPNYYNYSSYQSSASSPSSSTSSSTSSSLFNNNYSNNLITYRQDNEVSLSLWPLVSPASSSAAARRPVREVGPTFGLGHEFRSTQSYGSDVDTTLHL